MPQPSYGPGIWSFCIPVEDPAVIGEYVPFVFRLQCLNLYDLRIDNGDLEHMRILLPVFSDIFALNQSILIYYISNES